MEERNGSKSVETVGGSINKAGGRSGWSYIKLEVKVSEEVTGPLEFVQKLEVKLSQQNHRHTLTLRNYDGNVLLINTRGKM